MHIVNQSYIGDECVFELAMCFECRETINSQLSEQSRVAMFDFMHDHTNIEKREKQLGSNSRTDAYITHCITCGKARDEAKSYTTSALFSGSHLIKGPFPMLICGACEEKITNTISEETRDFWDKFINKHFPGPPSEVTLPTGKPILI